MPSIEWKCEDIVARKPFNKWNAKNRQCLHEWKPHNSYCGHHFVDDIVIGKSLFLKTSGNLFKSLKDISMKQIDSCALYLFFLKVISPNVSNFSF